VTQDHVPTCRIDDVALDVLSRPEVEQWETCIVVSEARVVLGRLSVKPGNVTAGVLVEDVMQPGPKTYRPDTPLTEFVERLARRRLTSALVTYPEGVLIGIAFRREAESYLERTKSPERQMI
jgi:hypothetical protein